MIVGLMTLFDRIGLAVAESAEPVPPALYEQAGEQKVKMSQVKLCRCLKRKFAKLQSLIMAV